MKIRTIGLVLAISMLTGCGTIQTAENIDEGHEDVVDEEIAEEQSNQDDIDAPWRQAYLDYLNSNEYAREDPEFSFSLIYLDDDDVPELFIDTGAEAGGQMVVGYYDDKLVEQQLSRLGSQYIEKSGLIYTNTGHMDYLPLEITKYEKGSFQLIGEGLAYLSDEDREKLMEDENYPYTLTYEWENEPVSEETFNEKVAELYDLEKSKYPDNFYTFNEFTYMLKTGKWTSYDHSYEFIISDVTWDEAQEACKKKGGYLATITCGDEAKKISSLIQEQGLEDDVLYVGFRSSEWVGEDFYTSRWINPNGSFEDANPAIYDFWEYKWPGYDSMDEEWRVERDETDCGLAKYNKQTNQIYVFDAPDELLTVSPQYAGKMGYICEFD